MLKDLRMWLAIGVCALGCLPAHAATTVFEFAWTGDPAQDSGLTGAADPDAFAFGLFEIAAGRNDRVGPVDVVSLEVTFGSSLFAPITVTGPAELSFFAFDGTVSADGASIAMRDLFLSVGGLGTMVQAFGCFSEAGDCRASDPFGDSIVMAAGIQLSFFYDSTEAAQASLRMTAREPVAVIPLPAALPLLLVALGPIVRARRRSAPCGD